MTKRKRSGASRSRKRSRKGRRRAPRKNLGPSRSLMPFPRTRRAKLKYYHAGFINPGANELGKYEFRANSVYDPDLTGGGHQPRGFDELMAHYDHFMVKGLTATVTFDNDNGKACIGGLCLRDTSSTTNFTTVQDLMEYSYKKSRILGHGGASNCVKTFSIACNPNQWAHVNRENQRGGASVNPAEDVILAVVGTTLDGSDGPAIRFYLTLTYDVLFIEPKALPGS